MASFVKIKYRRKKYETAIEREIKLADWEIC